MYIQIKKKLNIKKRTNQDDDEDDMDQKKDVYVNSIYIVNIHVHMCLYS